MIARSRPTMHRAIAVALAALTLALSASAAAASFPANTTLVLSGTPDLLNAQTDGSTAAEASLSADGRYVVYESDKVVNGAPVVTLVWRDLVTGETAPVNVADDGTPLRPNLSPTLSWRLSGDGKHVVFVALPPSQNTIHVYERDLSTNPPQTLIADRFSDTGSVAGGFSLSSSPTVSDDGSRVAFSTGTPLDPAADHDSFTDAYVHDFTTGQTLLADRAPGELAAKASRLTDAPLISGDGKHVVFDTPDPLDQAHDSGQGDDVYVRDLDTFTTTLASAAGRAGPTDKGDFDSFDAGISRDGSRVLLMSTATNFGVPEGSTQLYVRDLKAHTLELASRADGADGAPAGTSPGLLFMSLSADGRHVVWLDSPSTSIAPDAPGDGTGRVYERDLVDGNPSGGATRLISRAMGTGEQAGGLVNAGGVTADGGCVAFNGHGTLLAPPGDPGLNAVFLRVIEPDCGRGGPGPGPGPGSGPGPGPGPVKPALLSGLSIRAARFSVGGAKGGARIAFRLDKGSSVALSFDRLVAGRLKGRRCLTTARAGGRCTVVRHAGSLTVAGRAGANAVAFSGKLGPRALAPGSYRLTATPLHGRAVSVRFTVVRAPKQKARR
jgi:hypothetical protein